MIKKRLLTMLVLLAAVVAGAWAQTTINVTADDLGKAVCTDGSIYANVSAAQSAGKTAVAKIICLDTQNSKALALSLDNQAVPPATVNNATAQSRCEALNTTRAVTFGTWVLPSKAQWEAMIEAAGGYSALCFGFGIIFGGNQLEQALYWSSTAGTTGHWRINFHDGDWSDNTFDSSARACLVINLPQTYSVTLNDGTENPTTWTASTDGKNFGALPLKAAEGQAVTLKYSGDKKVKSVKAVKKGGAEPVDNTYQKWDDGQKKLVATDIPTTANKVQNSNEDVEWAAGTYVVEGNVTIKGTITLTGDAELIIKDGAKLTANQIDGNGNYNLSIYGQANQTGQLVVNCSDGDAITSITTLEVHSCQVKATSSGDGCGGFYNIDTFNVYGGSVDAENTGTYGCGIMLTLKGSMNIYGGDVKAVGKATSFGIDGVNATVTVYGGTLWAENAGNAAINYYTPVTLTKGAGFSGKIETSGDGSSWTEYTEAGTPGTKYVRVGY